MSIKGISINTNELGTSLSNMFEGYLKNDRSSVVDDAIKYYGTNFQTFLLRNMDNEMNKKNQDLKDKVFKLSLEKYSKGMWYCFNKGFLWAAGVLTDENGEQYGIKEFSDDRFIQQFIESVDQLIAPGELTEMLDREDKHVLDLYLHNNFLNTFQFTNKNAEIFFKKGLSEFCFYIQSKLGYVDSSKLTQLGKVSYSKRFEVTPAADAVVTIATEFVEEWTLYWNSTYGSGNSSKVIGRCLIQKLTTEDLLRKVEWGNWEYDRIEQILDNQMNNTNQPSLFCRLNILPSDDWPRAIETSELRAITNVIANMIQVNTNTAPENFIIELG